MSAWLLQPAKIRDETAPAIIMAFIFSPPNIRLTDLFVYQAVIYVMVFV
jgi:hypothetical protein